MGLSSSVESDVYSDICSRLPKLCPRLVPRKLWGVSLAGLARVDPVVLCDALGLGGDYASAIEGLREWWMGIPRRGVCMACGSRGLLEADEDWRYYIVSDEEGEAVLSGVRMLCSKCHLAKHQGYASARDKLIEALEQLSRVNNKSPNETAMLVAKALATWRFLSGLRRWSIRVKGLPGLDEEVRASTEAILNKMVEEGFSFDGKWLWYINYDGARALLNRARSETLMLLDEALASGVGDHFEWIIDMVRRELGSRGIRVLEQELREALKMIKPTEKTATLSGKWMIFADRRLRGKLLRRILKELRARGLNYTCKTTGSVEDGEAPVIIYVPSMLALDMVGEVASVISKAGNELGLSKPILFKPDIFTIAGLYSGASGMKPYIYMIK